jgi:hypothetical protein
MASIARRDVFHARCHSFCSLSFLFIACACLLPASLATHVAGPRTECYPTARTRNSGHATFGAAAQLHRKSETLANPQNIQTLFWRDSEAAASAAPNLAADRETIIYCLAMTGSPRRSSAQQVARERGLPKLFGMETRLCPPALLAKAASHSLAVTAATLAAPYRWWTVTTCSDSLSAGHSGVPSPPGAAEGLLAALLPLLFFAAAHFKLYLPALVSPRLTGPPEFGRANSAAFGTFGRLAG